MYQILQPLHSYFAFAALALLAWATINGLLGSTSNKIFGETELKVNKWALMATHTQLLLGFVLLFTSPITQAAFSDFGAAMKDSTLRLYALEHPIINTVAAILATIGSIKAKKAISHGSKYKSTFIFFGLALVLILSRLPWSAWID